MTVGQPETNLNTWGLRYVKKKSGYDKLDTKDSPFAGGAAIGTDKPAEPKPTQSKTGIEDAKPKRYMTDMESIGGSKTRQQDSTGDTKGVYSGGKTGWQNIVNPKGTHAGGEKVGEQTHHIPAGRKGEEFHFQEPKTTHGSDRGSGATDPASRTGEALTAGSKKTPVKPSSEPRTHTGSEGHDYTQSDFKMQRGGHSIKPDSRNPKSESKGKPSKTPKGTMIQRASLDLAIIKCKLLKMSDIKKDFIEDNKPTRPQFRKDDDEKEDKEKSEHKCESCGQATEQWEGNPDQVKRTDKEIKDKKLNQYKSNEIVEKAIELINEAYDEMKSTDFRKLKPIYEGDTKQAKKDAQTGEGSNKPSKRGDFKTDNRDLENSRNETSTSNLSEPASTMDQTPRDYEVTSSGKETGKKRVTNRPTNTFSPSPHQKEPQTSVEQADETAWDDSNRKWNKQVDSTNWGKDSAGSLAPEKSPERQGKGALKTDGGTSTTSSEGGFNHVYSDVHEAKRQKQNQ